jgi:type IV pilus assembly protein PilM
MIAKQSTQPKRFELFRSRRSARRVGWYGVDIGTSTIKIAQLARIGDGWRIMNRLAIPVDVAGTMDEARLRDGGLFEVLDREVTELTGFRRRVAACLLPMAAMDYRCLQLPAASEVELCQMARQELDDGASPASARRVADLWPSVASAQEEKGMQEVAVLSADESLVVTVADDLANLGFECRVVDGLPFALARAAKMALPHLANKPIAVVDWGYGSATFTVAKDGYPWFTRLLRCYGTRRLVEQVSEELSLKPAECQQLMSMYGIGASSGDVPANDPKLAVDHLIAPEVQNLVQELQKTLAYLQQQHAELCPEKILLTGGGAAIRNVTHAMRDTMGVEVDIWQLTGTSPDGGQSHDPTTALFAPALALSALGIGL